MSPPNRKGTVPADSPGPLCFPNRKRTAPADSPGLSGLPNRKQTALPDSPGPSGPPHRKRTAPPHRPGTTRTGTACTGESLLPVKKQRHFNAFLLPNHVEWPTLNKLWDVVRDSKSQAFLKSQGTLEEYTPAACIFVGRMSLIVRGLPLDHLMVIFRASAPP